MLLKRFWSSKGGNFAMMFGIAIIPLVLGAGVALDYSRMLRAKGHLQAVADAAALALAASKLDDQAELEKRAAAYIEGNFNPGILDSVTVQDVDHEGDNYEVAVSGQIPTTFMSIANINTLDIGTSALAVRGVTGSVEVALVLDNTDSMKWPDSSGVDKIEALRSAASDLVATLHKDNDATVRMAVVPYADYVNVGLSHRNDGWISVKADYSVTSEPPSDCGIEKERTYNQCVAWGPTKTCTRHRDGIVESYSCRDCTATEQVTEKYTPSCDVSTVDYKWFGCVGSRTDATLHLTDASPSFPYPGYVETKQKCPTPLLPLTKDEKAVQDAITNMKAGVKNYTLQTYIPSGLMWGLNVLSPSAPFDEGQAYDPANKSPRKVLVLMTDGENTLRYNQSNGKHPAMSEVDDKDGYVIFNAAQAQKTHDDTLELCRNIKAKGIEIFSIAFAVDRTEAKSLLETCATDKQHYFDANDSVALQGSFQQIADALTNVRLAR